MSPHQPDNLIEIQQQAASLRALLTHYQTPAGHESLAKARRWLLDAPTPIAMVGMGSSLFASQVLVDALPGRALLGIGADQLIHAQSLPQGMKYLFISQSGKSGELVALAQRFPQVMAQSLAITNDPASPLATAAGLSLPMCAGQELFSATKTFTNTLALLSLLSCPQSHLSAQIALLESTSHAMDQLCATWNQPAIKNTPSFVVGADHLGAGLARQSGLLFKEVARKQVEGLSIAQFRHGPQEIAVTGPRLLFIDAAPSPATIHYIQRLATLGAHPVLLTNSDIPGIPCIPVNTTGIGFALLAAIHLELAVYNAALGQPTPPGHYLVGGKVTGLQ
jgi:fructoselysine-6-P-deglycase FrlB-like protein